MDFEQFWNDLVRKIVIAILVLLAIVVLFLVLHRVTPAGVLYLFVVDLFHQILFYLGSVAALAEWFMIKLFNTPLERGLFTVVVIICLFAACFQAWTDEHRNSEQLIKDKAEISAQVEFWKSQSYQKDEAIRARDGLLAQNLTILSGTQQSLTDLSNKVLDITKPEPLSIKETIVQWDNINYAHVYQMLLLRNKSIMPTTLDIVCTQPIERVEAQIMRRGATQIQNSPQMLSAHRAHFSIVSPAWGPDNPLVISVFSSGESPACTPAY